MPDDAAPRRAQDVDGTAEAARRLPDGAQEGDPIKEFATPEDASAADPDSVRGDGMTDAGAVDEGAERLGPSR